MNWDALDYFAAFLLLGGGSVAYLIVRRLIAKSAVRLLAGLAIIAVVALTWIQLAVGIF